MSALAIELKEKLASLDAALDEQLPVREQLRDIHTILKKDPDNVTVMSEEEVAIVVRGLKKQTATEITTTALKSGRTKKAVSKLTVDDL